MASANGRVLARRLSPVYSVVSSPWMARSAISMAQRAVTSPSNSQLHKSGALTRRLKSSLPLVKPRLSQYSSLHQTIYAFFFNNRNTPASLPLHNHAHHSRYHQHQLCRSYWFLPTSWDELQLRMRSAAEKRTIQVTLLRDRVRLRYQSAKDRYRSAKDQANSTYQTTKSKYQITKSRYRDNYTRVKNQALASFLNQSLDANGERTIQEHRWLRRGWNRARDSATRQRDRWRSSTQRQILRSFLNRIMRVKRVTLTEYSQPDWFDATGRPLTARDITGRFVNPWRSESTGGVQSLANILKWRWQRLQREWKEYGWQIILPAFLVPSWTNPQVRARPDCDIVSPQSSTHRYYPSVISPGMPPLEDPKALRLTWIGHAACLVEQGNIKILTDPMFSRRAGPYFTNHDFSPIPVGVTRKVPPACQISDLPTIDFCLISHDHYDHLDQESVRQLNSLNKVCKWIVPLGMTEWLIKHCDMDRDEIFEMEWWESLRFEQKNASNKQWQLAERHTLETAPDHHPSYYGHPSRPFCSQDDEVTSIWFTACPTQHWASRSFFDRNFRLWCSFFVLFPNQSTFYFGGDTALPPTFPLFEQISDYLVGGRAHTAAAAAAAAQQAAALDGNNSSSEPANEEPDLSLADPGQIDLAALPIGAYDPDFFMRDAHVNPTEAVQIHTKLRARKSIGIHWGTFPLSEEPIEDPPRALDEAAQRVQADFTQSNEHLLLKPTHTNGQRL